MPLNESKGQMYDWVTHVHAHLGGECPHKCSYCYVGRGRFGRPAKYQGQPRLIAQELTVDYGSGKTIFIEHMNDMFAVGIKDEWIVAILEHTRKYPDNKYVFQSKNPARAVGLYNLFPKGIFGTTIETNRPMTDITKAPVPYSRFTAIKELKSQGWETFITIEPIMDFDVEVFVGKIARANPDFVNIGADSKKSNLPEPSKEKVLALIAGLQAAGIVIRKKTNLQRLGI